MAVGLIVRGNLSFR